MKMDDILPRHNTVMVGEPVKEPTTSARIFVKADIKIAGPVSSNT